MSDIKDITHNMNTHTKKIIELEKKFKSVYKTDANAANEIIKEMRGIHGCVKYDEFVYLLSLVNKGVDNVGDQEWIKVSTNSSFEYIIHKQIRKCDALLILNNFKNNVSKDSDVLSVNTESDSIPKPNLPVEMRGGDLNDILAQITSITQQGQQALGQGQQLINSLTGQVSSNPNVANALNAVKSGQTGMISAANQAKINNTLANAQKKADSLLNQGKQTAATVYDQAKANPTVANAQKQADALLKQGQQSVTSTLEQAKANPAVNDALNKLNTAVNQGQQLYNTAATQGSDLASKLAAIFKGGDDGYEELSIQNIKTESVSAPKKNKKNKTFTSDNMETTDYLNNLTTEKAESLYNQTGGNTNLDVNKPTLVNYWADWCGYSKKFLPTWNEFKSSAATKYPNLQITELNVSNDPKLREIASKADVKGYPTLVLFNNGKKYNKAGAISIEEVNKFVQENLKQ